VIRAPAVLQPRAQHTIYAPFDGQLTHLKSETKDRVSSGDVLAIMSSADLEFELQTLKRTIEDIRWQLDVRSFDLILLEQAQILETDYRTNLQRQIALEARLAQGTIRSPISGRVDILDLTLTTGMRLSAGAPLLSVSGEQWHVVAYVAEADLWRIAEQDKARFYANRGGRAVLPLQVAGIEEIALQELDSLYPATPFGGTIPVIAGENDTLVPLQAIYRVYLELPADFSPPERVLSGAVTISGKNESLLARFIRHLMGVFRRESGF
jgi:putative peptide zinc metalloprotease protein